jgi:hypothetical protein
LLGGVEITLQVRSWSHALTLGAAEGIVEDDGEVKFVVEGVGDVVKESIALNRINELELSIKFGAPVDV